MKRLLMCVLTVLIVLPAYGNEKAPLPDNVSYVKPADDVPKNIQNLLGKWEGAWGGNLNSYMIFEEVTANSAHMIYGWGTLPSAGITEGGYNRLFPRLIDKGDGSGIDFEFDTIKGTLSADGKTLNAVYQGREYITMQKTEDPFINNIPMKSTGILGKGNEKAPLPDSVSYVKPADDVPKNIQNLLGKWEGDWGGELNSYFIFENVTPNSAEMVYGWGTSALFGINQSGHMRGTALLETNNDDSTVKFMFTFQQIEGTVSYDGKTINAVWAGGRSKIKLRKTGSPDFELPEMVAKKPKVTNAKDISRFSAFGKKAPLPEKITYKKPAEDVPAKIQNLLGKWEGDWRGELNLNSYFIFENVTPDSAEMVYGWGTSPEKAIFQGGHERRTARLETNSDDSTVKFSSPATDQIPGIEGIMSYDGKTINAVAVGSKIKMNKTGSPDFELPEMVAKKPKVTKELKAIFNIEFTQQGEFTRDQLRTLNTFKKIGDYPLFEMHYNHDYHFDEFLKKRIPVNRTGSSDILPDNDKFACTCFASLSNKGDKVFGRNLDWDRHPTLVLFTNPPEAYRSVSIVDIHYLNYVDDEVLTRDEKQGLLNAHFMPFDGMNEHGLAVGMMGVPYAEDRHDPEKTTISIIHLIRLMLDYAKDVESALSLMEKYNIIHGNPPSHLLIADANGNSAVIEFKNGKRYILRNRVPWQVSTNFIISDVAAANRKAVCWRYRKASDMLEDANGNLTGEEAMNVLNNVADINTTWSAVYNMTAGEVSIALGKNYNKVFKFDLKHE